MARLGLKNSGLSIKPPLNKGWVLLSLPLKEEKLGKLFSGYRQSLAEKEKNSIELGSEWAHFIFDLSGIHSLIYY